MNITVPGFLIVCGLQGGGKSHYIKSVMYENRKKFDWGIVFSNTGFKEGNIDYIDKRFVHLNFNETAIIKMKDLHRELIEKGKSPSGFIIFDDCLQAKQWKSEEFQSLMTQVRHYGITCIISTQNPRVIPNEFRNQVFQAAMFRMGNRYALRSMFDSYGSAFDEFDEFKKYIASNTNDHQFVFYNARAQPADPNNPTIEDFYTVCKAPAVIPKFMMKFKKRI